MTRRYKYTCAAIAIALVPGGIAITAAVFVYRLIRRRRHVQQAVQAVVDLGGVVPAERGQA